MTGANNLAYMDEYGGLFASSFNHIIIRTHHKMNGVNNLDYMEECGALFVSYFNNI